jgi:hypothetical protein
MRYALVTTQDAGTAATIGRSGIPVFDVALRKGFKDGR